MTPARVESSLLVVEPFTDSAGTEWRVGDRATLARRAVRRAATERPELFRVEFATEEFGPEADWFQEVEARYEARYEERRKAHEAEAAQREKALREEMRQQEKGQPDLERRFKQQEAEKERREKEMRERDKRERIERELEYGLGPPGFHN